MGNERDPRAMNPTLGLLEHALSDEEKMYANEIIDLGNQLISCVDRIATIRGRTVDLEGRLRPPELQCARERVQEAVFWVVQFLAS